MVSWGELARAEPEFSASVLACFSRAKHSTMATLRRDGAPRISGTEVVFDDEMWLGSMAGSLKARDLMRDPRIAVHSPTADPPQTDPAGWPGEAKIAGRAFEEGDLPPGAPPGHRFRIDITEASFVRVAPSGDRLLIDVWRPAEGVTRRERR
jgi:hypothetical protein